MKISVLTDNHAGSSTRAEHGLSYLIEFDGKKILFDTGQSDLFIRNSEKMKLSIENTDIIILSHGHFDHGNGLSYLSGGKLLCHPGCFVRRFRKSDKAYIGLSFTKEELMERFSVHCTTKPLKISERIFFLSQIPRITTFESQTTPFVFEEGNPDFVEDDSGIAMLLPEGIFVVTGCGHAGIVNTLLYAKSVTGSRKISGIMGGFHLKERDIQTTETINYLKENKVKNIFPSHCTELPALASFYDNFFIRQLKTGDILNF